MFCPKCGQSQVADEVRYCPRCGFALGGVTQLLAHDGAWPEYLPPADGRLGSPRRKGMKQGGKLLLVGVFLVPVLAILVSIIGSEAYELVLLGVLVAIVGIVRLFYALLFEDKFPTTAPAHLAAQQASAPPQFNPAPRRAALPQQQQQQGAPIPVSFRARDTGELAGPGSVTENTTRLLDPQNDPRER